jgi:hypothetical protein
LESKFNVQSDQLCLRKASRLTDPDQAEKLDAVLEASGEAVSCIVALEVPDGMGWDGLSF